MKTRKKLIEDIKKYMSVVNAFCYDTNHELEFYINGEGVTEVNETSVVCGNHSIKFEDLTNDELKELHAICYQEYYITMAENDCEGFQT